MAFLGFDSTRKPFNQKIMTIFALFAVNSALTVGILTSDTISFVEYIIAFYLASGDLLAIIIFAIFAIKMTNIFTFFIDGENLIKSSKYKHT